MCLELLQQDFDSPEVHMIIQEVFHTLGFKNELVEKTKEELKKLVLANLQK